MAKLFSFCKQQISDRADGTMGSFQIYPNTKDTGFFFVIAIVNILVIDVIFIMIIVI